MPSFADFRSRFPSLQDASDEEIIKRTSEVFKLPITEVAQSFDYNISGGKTSQRFGASIDRYQAGLYGTAEAVTKAVGLEGTSDYLQKQRVRNEAQADISSARARELGAIESYKDVTGVGTGVDYVTGLAIGSAPYMAEALVTGGGGRLAMTGTRAALTEGRTALAAAEAAKDVAAADKARQAIAVAERNLNIGSTASGFAGQYPSGVGEMLSQQREQTGGQTDLTSALGYGAGYTALGMVGVEGALTRGNLFRNTINFLDKPGGLSGAALRTGATAVSTGLKEGVSETLQEGTGQGARMAVDDKAQFFDQDAVERYKESFVGGAALGGVMGGGLGGWRRSNSILPGATTDPTQPQAPANNDIQQAFGQSQTSGTPTTNLVPPPPAPPITPSADTTPPPAPIVSGGTTPIAQATQQQSQADAAAQQQQQLQAQRDLTISQFGLTGDTPGTGSFFGRPIFGPAINQVADALAPIAAQLNPAEAAIMDAIVTADQKLGNKLLSFQFNADKIANSVQKGVQAVTTAATKFQIADVQTVGEAAYRLNELSKSAKGQALEQINAIHEALTGKDTEGYIASQTSKPKGKSNVQQQQQMSSGLGTVPVQGGTIQGDGGLTGLLQPGAVQPVGAGVVSGAANDQQAGQLPGEGIRTGPSVAPADDLGGAAQTPQDVSGAPSETTVATAPSAQNVEANAPVLEQGVQRGGAAPTGTVQTQEGLSPGRVAWEEMDGTGTSFDDLPENLQQVWERAVAENRATGDIQETLAASAQDTSLAAKARAVLRAALDMVIQPTSRMSEDVAARKREFVAAYWGGARSDALTKVAADLGISKDQAKRWSAELPNFLTVNGQKIKAAVETVAKERGIDIADVLDGLRSIEEQHPTEEMVDEIEGTGQSTSATEEPLFSDQEDIEVDQGQLNKAPEEELNTAEADAGQNDFVISSRKSASLQEQNNAVETNQAKIMRLLDMQDKINEAESIENPPAPKIVSLSEAALEKLGGDVTKLKEHDLLNLAVNAKLTENFELADQLNAELSSRIEKALEKAQKQADQKTQKGTTNAVQEPSTEKVSVPEGAAGGQEVGKGVAKVGKATRVRKAKVEKPVETKVEEVTPAVLTPKEQWDALTQQFPGMPPYDVLTKSEKETWDDFANRGFGDIGSVATVLGGADKIAKAPEAVTEAAAPAIEPVVEPAAEPVAETAAPVEETVQEQVTEEVIAPQLEALPEAQVQRLETHYGEKRDSASFLTKVKEDVVLYATKGAQAVAGAIRDVIKAIHAGVLSVAMVFNPGAISQLESFVVIPQETQTTTQQVLAEVPADVVGMSDAGKQAYATLIPALKGKLGDKFITIADKPSGRIFVFKADGSLVLQKKALFGLAKGDLYKGNNDVPSNRVTPAGLFGINIVDAAKGGAAAKTAGDYDFGKVFALDDPDATVTFMHSVWLKESDAPKRAAALKNESATDSRYSFGCINVDKETFKDMVTKYSDQMDGSKLFVVPDAQSTVNDFVTGNVANDRLIREGVQPVTRTTTTPVKSATQTAGVNRTVVGKEEQAPTTQQSRANQPVVERYTAEELQTSLLDYVNRESLGKDVFVVDELEDLRSLPEFAAMTDEEFANFLTKEKIDGQTQAFVTESGKAYLLASNIDVGTGRGVFMHEVGVHLGLQEKLPDASFARLVDQIKVWAKLNDGSIENQLAIAASDRVFQSRVSDPVQRRREFVAYFVEAAVNAGLDPKAYENIKSAGLREWMRSLWAAFKNALRKLRGINVDKLSAQDVVDMAYGYAQMAIGAPKFQGSGKIFRKFQIKFAGTGVGQMYGHGMYFTNKPEVAASFAKGKTPQLYGADLAVTDDELMGWATPLSQQSATVQQATTDAAKELGVVTGQNVRGGNFYSDLGEQLYKKATGKNITTKAQVSESQRMASEWLDAHGVKGIKYGGDNYVVFNEDNIIRVNRTPGAPTGRMDKGRPEVEWGSVQQSRRVDAAVNLLPPKLRSPVKSTTTNLLYQAKQGVLASAITEDVINMASKFMKSAKTYLAAQYARQATRLNHELKIDKILTQFDKLPKNLQGTGEGSVNKYIFDSTREGKWGYIPDERMVGTTLLTVDPDMKARFDAFPQDAQKLIRDVFEQGYDALDAKQNAVKAAVDREYADRLKAVQGDTELTDKLNKEKKLALSRERKLLGLDSSKPYAYLGRYGDYVVVGKSAEYKFHEEQVKAGPVVKGEDLMGARSAAWLDENRTNPAHYVVQFAETLGEANQIADQLNATGNYDIAESYEKEPYSQEGGDLFLAVARLRTLFDKEAEGANPAAQASIRNLLGDLYLHTVSEASSRKSEFQRLNISGADQDMMRNLATRGRADAHFLAALEHNDAISDAITAMREERNRNRGEAGPYFNELLKRHANSMKYETPGVLSSALLRMSNVWYLATNPAYYLQQILQTGVLSLPYMSGRLGYFRSARAVKKAYGDMATLVKGLGVGDHIDFNKAPADVREMLTKLVGMGKIDIGIDSDARVRAGEAGVAAKVMQKLQGVNNRIEAVNRATAAIAAYRGYLDRYKNGDTAAATAYAADVVSNTHGSYDAFNTPRIMQTGAGKVLLQFKRFQIIQISMLLKLINTAFKGASQDEKAVARRALGFIAGHMMVLGGAIGVPLVQQFGSLLLKAFGDDDEPENLELTLRRLINDPVMADLLINGVPGALGVNLGSKLGMGNVFSILPFTDIDFTSRAGAEKMLVGIMGPSAGLGLKFADGLGQMASGEYYKGLESMLPSGVANVMKAGRFATEGVTMRNGDVVLKPEEISMFDAAFQAVGLPTTTLTDRQFTQRVVAEFDKFYDKRTTEIKGDYVNASRDGDVNGMADAREEWSKLQESRVKNGYKRQPLSDLFRAPSAAAKRERNIAGGVEFSKSNRQFVESLSTL